MQNEIFSKVKDPRVLGKVKHELEDVLRIALIGVLCSCEDYDENSDLIEDRAEEFRRMGFLRLTNGVPSGDTIMKIKSRRRNPVLADIFSRLKYMERRGSGFKKICNVYAHQVNYREDIKPEFYSDNSDFVLTLFNLNYGINAESYEYIQDAVLHQTVPNAKGTDTDLPQTAPNCPKLPQT